MVTLPHTSSYTAKDQKKADISNKFIGLGSARSSTAAYAQAYGSNANCGTYTFGDVVFISAEGARSGRKSIPVDEITLAAQAGVVFVTDDQTNRLRSYNIGEREVESLLKSLGYIERAAGYWIAPDFPYPFNLVRGDLFSMDADAICITTNGFIKRNGHAVMGRGCAKQAATYVPTLPQILGDSLRTKGNQVAILMRQNGTHLVAFPVKPVSNTVRSLEHDVVEHMRNSYRIGDIAAGWACVADPHIIACSCKELTALADMMAWTRVILPMPGCGAGELNWNDVHPILSTYLDARFFVATF